MQQRVGLLFLSRSSGRILLIHENQKWTVPTFVRKSSVLEDAKDLLSVYSTGRIMPIELYLSEDKGFEYGTYICIVDDEFLTSAVKTLAWCDFGDLPKNLHSGLKATLNNQIIKTKIETILELEHVLNVGKK
jgi:hypothetical protein